MKHVRRWTGLHGVLLSCALLSLIAASSARGEPGEWVFHGSVAEGGQIDATRGPGDTIHLVSSKYYQFDADGAKIAEESQGDEKQGSMDFPPAIAVCGDGSVHIVTRHGGDWSSGHDIRYRKRSPEGSWDVDYTFGERWARNYVVGVGCAEGGHVAMFYSEVGGDVWGDLHLWEAGSGSATDLGRLGGIWRADTDARMRGDDGKIFLVSGKVDGDGRAYFLHAEAGSGLRDQLDGSKQEHSSGSGRRGFPDMVLDGTDTIHVTYGAEQTVYYNSYTFGGTRVHGSDIEIFSGLGTWHLSTGLSAVAASDDGMIVVAVGLKSDGSQGASDSDLLWNYSEDGGSTWGAQQDTGRNTDGGEGRHRPRLAAIGNKFFLFYGDRGESGISLATLEFEAEAAEEEEAAPEVAPEPDPDPAPDAADLVEDMGEPAGDVALPDAAADQEGDTAADGIVGPDGGDDTNADTGVSAVSGGCGCNISL
ncbi:MAG: hypothetical protein ABIJ56_07830 [Pseudomonadota bacterium]